MAVRETGKRKAGLDGNSWARREYTVMYAANEILAIEELRDWLTAEGLDMLGGLFRGPIEGEGFSKTEDGVWAYKCTVTWQAIPPREAQQPSSDEPEISDEEWDFGVESVKILIPDESITTALPTGASGFPPNLRLIGDRCDGNPAEGVEWPSPVDNFSIPWVYNNSSINSGFRTMIRELRGKLNASVFRDYPTECCLYLGCSKKPFGRTRSILTHRFTGRMPKDVELSGFATLSDVPGFEAIWTGGGKEVTEHKLGEKPAFLARCRVGKTGDFSSLGVG